MSIELICGDNLPYLRQNNSPSIDLIYIDPPFNSRRDYKMKDGTVAFSDIWHNVPYADVLEELKPMCPDLYGFIALLQTTKLPESYLSYLCHMSLRCYYTVSYTHLTLPTNREV